MKKYYVIKTNNGEEWGIPAHIIAEDRANYYAKDDENKWNEEYNAMMKWFDTCDYEFVDWAKNNMDWPDVKVDAILLNRKYFDTDYQECWINGEYEFRTIN